MNFVNMNITFSRKLNFKSKLSKTAKRKSNIILETVFCKLDFALKDLTRLSASF